MAQVSPLPLSERWSVASEVRVLTLEQLHALCGGSVVNFEALQSLTSTPPSSERAVPTSAPEVPSVARIEEESAPVQPLSPHIVSLPQQPRSTQSIPGKRKKLQDEVRDAVISTVSSGTSQRRELPETDTSATSDALLSRVRRIQNFPLDYIPNPIFERARDDGKVEREILEEREEEWEYSDRKKVKIPAGLPAYLASLYEIPLLSREQEYHLFRRMNYLKYVASARRAELDPASPSKPLMDTIERLHSRIAGARNAIIRANLRLVVSIAKKYSEAKEHFFELVSDGNISLLRAAEKFDFGRGFKFSTYASWAIMKNFARTIPQEKQHQAREKTVSFDDLTPLMGAEERDLDFFDQAGRGRLQIDTMDRLLQVLDEREFEIVVLRFGLDGEGSKTLKETGGLLGVTKERIRQLQARAMAKLKQEAKRVGANYSQLFPNDEE